MSHVQSIGHELTFIAIVGPVKQKGSSFVESTTRRAFARYSISVYAPLKFQTIFLPPISEKESRKGDNIRLDKRHVITSRINTVLSQSSICADKAEKPFSYRTSSHSSLTRDPIRERRGQFLGRK
jgi:hypothetical protein